MGGMTGWRNFGGMQTDSADFSSRRIAAASRGRRSAGQTDGRKQTWLNKAEFAGFLAGLWRLPIWTARRNALAVRWKNQADVKALHALTRAHMRLVIALAVRFRHYGLSLADLIQEGHIGLLEAAARFEPERDVRFPPMQAGGFVLQCKITSCTIGRSCEAAQVRPRRRFSSICGRSARSWHRTAAARPFRMFSPISRRR